MVMHVRAMKFYDRERKNAAQFLVMGAYIRNVLIPVC